MHWAKVDVRRPDECWPWLGHRNASGYGTWHPSPKVKLLAHRVAYEAIRGPIPEGLVIDHLCRNRACCNPAHMEVVTIGENVMRGDTIPARHAARTHCVNGHEFTPDNLKKPRGRGRECRACDLARKRVRS